MQLSYSFCFIRSTNQVHTYLLTYLLILTYYTILYYTILYYTILLCNSFLATLRMSLLFDLRGPYQVLSRNIKIYMLAYAHNVYSILITWRTMVQHEVYWRCASEWCSIKSRCLTVQRGGV